MPYLYDIPLRSYLSRNIQNLMFAGRNMSASHVAFSSTRVMATCAVTGEGVGLAAALSVRKKINPDQLPAMPELIDALRQQLIRLDAFVIGVVDSHIEIIFNSGLHRRLTLTMSDSIASQFTWGAGQPELVKDFSVQQRNASGEWCKLIRELLGWQRRWTRDLPEPISTAVVRISVNETWGCDHARILAVRIIA